MLALALAFGLLGAHLLALGETTLALIRYPFEIDYGEGIVWQQMLNMLRGTGYAPLGTYPAIVYHYPPVFHMVTAATVAMTGLDGLAAGRLVSALSTVGDAAGIGWLVWQVADSGTDRIGRTLAAIAGGMIFLSVETVSSWASLMRVDMLACFLSVTGLALACRGLDHPYRIAAAAFCFTAAIYTKQVSIAAPAAAFSALLATRPAQAWQLAGVTLASSLTTLAILVWITSGGFLTHVFLYNVNRIRPELIWTLAAPLADNLLYIALAVAGAVMLARKVSGEWHERQTNAGSVAARSGVLVYFGLKTVMLVMIVKSGANLNYMIEWFGTVAILAATAATPCIEKAVTCFRGGARRGACLSVAILAGIAVQAACLARPPITADMTTRSAERLGPVVALVRRSPRPVITDRMTLLIRAGRSVEWEPAITAELASAGRYDQAGFIRMIRAHRFGMFITQGQPGDESFDARYNPPVVAAITAAYPVIRHMDGLTLRFPAEGGLAR